jgi:hypothetical protein
MPNLGGATTLYDRSSGVKEERYKTTQFMLDEPWGMLVYFSPDGFNWTPFTGNPALRLDHNDIWDPSHDPALKLYYVVMRPMENHVCTDLHGMRQSALIRQTWISTSTDFKTWTKPVRVFLPDSRDEGITEWYGACAGIRRGEYFILMLRELRDDVKVSTTSSERYACNRLKYEGGYGYTVLMWTRDGEHWYRDCYKDVFFEPDPNPAAWDHAHATHGLGLLFPSLTKFGSIMVVTSSVISFSMIAALAW